jgi:peptidoglycan/xylan/chitin deacetylase (PgdA/CDA1 family)
MPCATFARQISWLERRFEVVGLQEAQRRIASGKNHVPTACITFDDGYADNLDFAIPLLLGRGLPFTYFVCSDHVRKRLPFPHDVAAGVTLAPNRAEDLRQLAAWGVEIGAHTRTHADLGKLTGESLRKEIVDSKREIERITGQPVRYMAFPYGLHENLSTEAFRVAREAGYLGVCSAYGGYNFPGHDPFHLERFHADCEFVRFRTWLGVDRRKRRLVNSFSWQEANAARAERPNSVDSAPSVSQPVATGGTGI